ncbi:hypothetical protein F8M41_004514 [Gigaspora margarita]|uniref:Uncharacterized protein n=1 Tax=Gigaspora margarita TaxID=4874 RepID=A0A8H4AXN7_GIGMA|nr:hypothetical protein F8M41_004514 [Gigaspora margarita]
MHLSAIIKNNDYERYQELFIEDSASVISVGAHLCKSGYTTHVIYGDVITLNAVVVNIEMIVFDVVGFFGDSDGPVYSNALHLEPFVTVSSDGARTALYPKM